METRASALFSHSIRSPYQDTVNSPSGLLDMYVRRVAPARRTGTWIIVVGVSRPSAPNYLTADNQKGCTLIVLPRNTHTGPHALGLKEEMPAGRPRRMHALAPRLQTFCTPYVIIARVYSTPLGVDPAFEPFIASWTATTLHAAHTAIHPPSVKQAVDQSATPPPHSPCLGVRSL
jgi:hypothetical protein